MLLLDAETLQIWGTFYATHVSKDISQPSEKASWISLFFGRECYLWRTNANTIQEALCSKERHNTPNHWQYTWVTHCSPRITCLPFSYITGVQLLHVPYSNVCKNLGGSYRERPCSKVTMCKLHYGVSVWNQIIIEIEWEGGVFSHGRKKGTWSQMQFSTCDSNRERWSEYRKSGLRWPVGFHFSIVLCEFSTCACAYGPFVLEVHVFLGAPVQFPVSTCHYFWHEKKAWVLVLFPQTTS